MTVAELIELLQTYDPELLVVVDRDTCGEYPLDKEMMFVGDYKGKPALSI